ncbi:MAG TPA: sigma-70 family RNA polymerase sigma factor [Pirellulaceae bacterium]|nr:sigma-70 family RNA polymerase sigma factor [Planctomycetales bacterium]MCB9936901.1 sigma-70 family RNA polymerase sigma factor [Planctomycetaceae bacterium]HRX78754.1 sigma-70 family RNA polymerase sigma factor [Pirellulaceae bacterium]
MNEGQLNIVALISASQGGSSDALGKLLDEFQGFLHYVTEQEVGPLLRKRLDGQDIVQQANLQAVKYFSQFQGSTAEEFTAWIRQVLRSVISNAVRDHGAAKRDIKKEQPFRQANNNASVSWWEPAASQTTPSQRVVKGEEAIRLTNAVQQLPPAQREAVRLRHFHNFTFKQIAEHMDCKLSETMRVYRLGMESLRRTLGDSSMAISRS